MIDPLDYFAGLAMRVYLQCDFESYQGPLNLEKMASTSYSIAEAMMKERAKHRAGEERELLENSNFSGI